MATEYLNLYAPNPAIVESTIIYMNGILTHQSYKWGIVAALSAGMGYGVLRSIARTSDAMTAVVRALLCAVLVASLIVPQKFTLKKWGALPGEDEIYGNVDAPMLMIAPAIFTSMGASIYEIFKGGYASSTNIPEVANLAPTVVAGAMYDRLSLVDLSSKEYHAINAWQLEAGKPAGDLNKTLKDYISVCGSREIERGTALQDQFLNANTAIEGFEMKKAAGDTTNYYGAGNVIETSCAAAYGAIRDYFVSNRFKNNLQSALYTLYSDDLIKASETSRNSKFGDHTESEIYGYYEQMVQAITGNPGDGTVEEIAKWAILSHYIDNTYSYTGNNANAPDINTVQNRLRETFFDRTKNASIYSTPAMLGMASKMLMFAIASIPVVLLIVASTSGNIMKAASISLAPMVTFVIINVALVMSSFNLYPELSNAIAQKGCSSSVTPQCMYAINEATQSVLTEYMNAFGAIIVWLLSAVMTLFGMSAPAIQEMRNPAGLTRPNKDAVESSGGNLTETGRDQWQVSPRTSIGAHTKVTAGEGGIREGLNEVQLTTGDDRSQALSNAHTETMQASRNLTRQYGNTFGEAYSRDGMSQSTLSSLKAMDASMGNTRGATEAIVNALGDSITADEKQQAQSSFSFALGLGISKGVLGAGQSWDSTKGNGLTVANALKKDWNLSDSSSVERKLSEHLTESNTKAAIDQLSKKNSSASQQSWGDAVSAMNSATINENWTQSATEKVGLSNSFNASNLLQRAEAQGVNFSKMDEEARAYLGADEYNKQMQYFMANNKQANASDSRKAAVVSMFAANAIKNDDFREKMIADANDQKDERPEGMRFLNKQLGLGETGFQNDAGSKELHEKGEQVAASAQASTQAAGKTANQAVGTTSKAANLHDESGQIADQYQAAHAAQSQKTEGALAGTPDNLEGMAEKAESAVDAQNDENDDKQLLQKQAQDARVTNNLEKQDDNLANSKYVRAAADAVSVVTGALEIKGALKGIKAVGTEVAVANNAARDALKAIPAHTPSVAVTKAKGGGFNIAPNPTPKSVFSAEQTAKRALESAANVARRAPEKIANIKGGQLLNGAGGVARGTIAGVEQATADPSQAMPSMNEGGELEYPNTGETQQPLSTTESVSPAANEEAGMLGRAMESIASWFGGDDSDESDLADATPAGATKDESDAYADLQQAQVPELTGEVQRATMPQGGSTGVGILNVPTATQLPSGVSTGAVDRSGAIVQGDATFGAINRSAGTNTNPNSNQTIGTIAAPRSEVVQPVENSGTVDRSPAPTGTPITGSPAPRANEMAGSVDRSGNVAPYTPVQNPGESGENSGTIDRSPAPTGTPITGSPDQQDKAVPLQEKSPATQPEEKGFFSRTTDSISSIFGGNSSQEAEQPAQTQMTPQQIAMRQAVEEKALEREQAQGDLFGGIPHLSEDGKISYADAKVDAPNSVFINSSGENQVEKLENSALGTTPVGKILSYLPGAVAADKIAEYKQAEHKEAVDAMVGRYDAAQAATFASTVAEEIPPEAVQARYGQYAENGTVLNEDGSVNQEALAQATSSYAESSGVPVDVVIDDAKVVWGDYAPSLEAMPTATSTISETPTNAVSSSPIPTQNGGNNSDIPVAQTGQSSTTPTMNRS